MRSTAAGVLSDFRSANPDVVTLVEVATGDAGTPFIRRCDRESSATFSTFTFEAQPHAFGQIQIAAHTEQGGVDVRLADLDGAIAALALGGSCFRHTRVRIWTTNVGSLGGAGSDGFLETTFVETVECEDGAVVIHCGGQFAVFDLDLPRGRLTRTEFPGLPSDGL